MISSISDDDDDDSNSDDIDQQQQSISNDDNRHDDDKWTQSDNDSLESYDLSDVSLMLLLGLVMMTAK